MGASPVFIFRPRLVAALYMPATPLLTAQTLLEALRPDQPPEAWLAQVSARQIDWNDLVVRAVAFGLAPQLAARLCAWEAPAPAHALAKLGVIRQAQAARSAAIMAELGSVLAACAVAEIRPIALKGVHLAALVYPAPELRPMNDIDLLFTPAEMPRVAQLLAGLGYGGKHKSAEIGPGVTKHTATYKRVATTDATPNPYLSATNARMIEPHTSLEETWFGLQVDITPGIRERALSAQLAGQPCRVLASEDLLLHLCLHFCFHLIQGAPALVQFSDLLAVTQAGGLDWGLFSARAAERRAAPFALAGLRLAQRWLGAPVSAETLADLEHATPPHLRRRIHQLGLADILRRTQQAPLTSFKQRLQRGLSDRAETARWAADWRQRWRVWRTLLQPARTDTGQLLLGRPLKRVQEDSGRS